MNKAKLQPLAGEMVLRQDLTTSKLQIMVAEISFLQFQAQFAESTRLGGEIKKNLAGLGYGF